ncbi:uncharacterized protein LOC113462829 isoform X2 [Phoenix dactylifera]|uniref:Uncharacterized protein LOC113462829 isoform X2 n=1 Tax=Phoenix dactylifera TaxID=42345 RepID=A0A8B8J5T4_PHODC|nr:uncharacterized protein LOC113462829 isoform X2 [Phoenix dactylifera]
MNHVSMQHNLAGQSGLTKAKLSHGEAEPPACPKPRRPGLAVQEFLYPLNCKHSHSSHQGSSDVLGMISSKNDAGREAMSTGCPPSCYCGSPPTRSDNPLVHDVQFVHQACSINWLSTGASAVTSIT